MLNNIYCWPCSQLTNHYYSSYCSTYICTQMEEAGDQGVLRPFHCMHVTLGQRQSLSTEVGGTAVRRLCTVQYIR